MDGVPTPSVGTGRSLSVGTFFASGRPADAQKRVPTEKTYPREEEGNGVSWQHTRSVCHQDTPVRLPHPVQGWGPGVLSGGDDSAM